VGSGAVGSDEGVDVGMTVVGLEDVGGDEPGFGVVGFDVGFDNVGFDVGFDDGFLDVGFLDVGFEVGVNEVGFDVGLAVPALAPVGFDDVGIIVGFAAGLVVAEMGALVVGGPDEHPDVSLTSATTASLHNPLVS